ncbi:MAG: ATP-dependent zinc metalloprotease FtsH [Erysipelotrichaceae bacterium]|nr:ATP-dependent zinc metalloprotease FtsH [Erysipelotrichaceae bacterium]
MNFATNYNFSKDRVAAIEVNLGYIKSEAVVVYYTNENKKAVATLEWSANEDYIIRVENAISDLDYFYKSHNLELFKLSREDKTNSFTFVDFIIYFLPTILMVVLMVFLFRGIMKSQGGAGGAMDFGKSKARLEDASKTRFSDVAGCEDEKAEMQEIVDYLKNPRKYAKAGARIPNGVILKGQPGTGKTLLARAVAGEANVPFYYISGSDFLEMFVGVGASRVRDMFKKARSTAPCIVFIDEIDAIGRQRGTGLGGGHDEREQTLNQLLVEMDGFEANSGVIVLAATNRVDVLDPALLRPGRFDRQIEVSLPDIKGRIAILQVHARNKDLASDVSLESVAKRTPGFSGAQLENVLNEAAILSVRSNHDKISSSDIDEAIDRVMGGPAKKTRVISDRCKKMVAYHEAGHAVVGLKVADAEVVQKITIIPRGDAGGYVLMTPKDDSYLQTKGELTAKITSYLAGRASEEIFFEDITTGAVSDIERATNIARAMVTYLGMSPLGPIKYETSADEVFLGRDYGSANKISGAVANEIDIEVRKIIDGCLAVAKKTIEDNKDLLILIAEALLKYETITADEIEFLVQYGSLDAYDAYKQNSENLAKKNAVNETSTLNQEDDNNEGK